MFIRWEYILSHLLIGLIFILGFVFLLTKAPIFRNIMLKKRPSLAEKILYTLFFGMIGILGTYTGFTTTDGIANTRAVGVIVGGLVGGPYVGLGAGLLAGIHRYFVGGLTSGTSAVAAIIQGALAGFCYFRFRRMSVRWPYALLLGFCLEVFHMGLLLLSPPFERAIQLVQSISPSMLIIGPLGIASFIAILDSVYAEQEKVEGQAARMALQIAGRTLAYLRTGLNKESACKMAETILQCVSNLDAVAVVSTDAVLAFIGPGADHHLDGVINSSTREVLLTGRPYLAQRRQEIGCDNVNCPLQAKVAVALKDQDVVVGALVFYKTVANSINPFEIELINGLAQLISTQIEVSKVEQQSALRSMAEIRALQAQINPHFLFNALNTIVYYCRKQPEVARELLLNLGNFYRNNLSHADEWVDLHTELRHIDAYVRIEAARFQGKLEVSYDVSADCHIQVPPLILQPIVENAVKHGLYPRKNGGKVSITSQVQEDRVLIIVTDNGVGIPPAILKDLLNEDLTRKSIGLSNVHGRLQAIYGREFGLTMESTVGKGTRITIPFPLGKEHSHASHSDHC